MRWAVMLRSLGHRTTVAQTFVNQRCDLLIALHARRSFLSVQRYRRLRGDAPLIVALTGTDLYHDLPRSKRARRSLDWATRLVTLQSHAVQALPKACRDKARVIYQSVPTPSSRPAR